MSLFDRITTPNLTEQEPGPITTWSFSLLKKAENCPFSVYLTRVRGIKEPQNPAATRGVEYHTMLENYVLGVDDKLPPKVANTPDALARMEARRAARAEDPNNVLCETQWGFTKAWTPTGWMAEDVWGRFGLDLLERESPTSVIISDYKTGKSFGNELKHSEQLMFYAVAAFKYIPELEHAKCQIEYVDEGRLALEKRFTRAQAELMFNRINERALLLTTRTSFPPNPSRQNCRFCHLKSTIDEETGEVACPYGVVE